MLARSNTIKHPSGATIQTPMLVSSFSSKGFRFIRVKKDFKSEAFELIRHTAEHLSETVLLSAFDLHYYFPKIQLFRNIEFKPQLTFIDSGGYETIDGYGFSENYKHPIIEKEWSLNLYDNILKTWPEYYPAVIVSYDNGNDKKKSISKQIDSAAKLFDKYPKHLNDILIKPYPRGDFLNINEIIDNISLLKRFNIIGFTEKELGESIIERGAIRNVY